MFSEREEEIRRWKNLYPILISIAVFTTILMIAVPCPYNIIVFMNGFIATHIAMIVAFEIW